MTTTTEPSSLSTLATSGPGRRSLIQQGAAATSDGTGLVSSSVRCCVGCRHSIRDEYVLHVEPDLNWHIECLRCTECLRSLDENCTCFVKDGRPYCKPDYARLFGVKCSRCGLDFDRNHLVMRARDRVYHVECFRCIVCQIKLVPGSEFALRSTDSGLVCRSDYDAGVCDVVCDVSMTSLDSVSVPADGCLASRTEAYGVTSPDAITTATIPAVTGVMFYGNNNNIENEIETKTRTGFSDSSASSGGSKKHSSSVGGTRHSGSRGSGKSSGSIGHTPNEGQGHHTSSSSTKTTRIRTVLNEKQLHTLRTCYAANPRPDALMKDQLVEMTGLSSRVIRVWFQNKRCKDKKRTILIKQMQQHHQDKVHGVPMIASSPVRMQDHQTAGIGLLQASAVQIHHQYILHQPTSQQQNAQQPWSAACSSVLSEYPGHHPGTSAAVPATAARSSSASSSSTSPTSLAPTDLDSESTVAFQQMLDSYAGRPPPRPSTNSLDDIDDIDDVTMENDEDVGTAAAAAMSLFPDDDDTVVSLDEPYGGKIRRGHHQRNRNGSLNTNALLTAVASRAHNHFATVAGLQHQQSRSQPLMMRRSPSVSMVDGGGGHTNGLMSVMTSANHLMCTDARC